MRGRSVSWKFLSRFVSLPRKISPLISLWELGSAQCPKRTKRSEVSKYNIKFIFVYVVGGSWDKKRKNGVARTACMSHVPKTKPPISSVIRPMMHPYIHSRFPHLLGPRDSLEGRKEGKHPLVGRVLKPPLFDPEKGGENIVPKSSKTI